MATAAIQQFELINQDNRYEYVIKRNRADKSASQTKYCEAKGLPRFAPETCYSCGTPAFDKYSFEECSSELITGCRNCCRSFCD